MVGRIEKGGIGLRPGETQLETDRRLLRGRIKSILKRLDKVAKQREQGRRARRNDRCLWLATLTLEINAIQPHYRI